MAKDVDVLVAGAGPVGLFLACALARHGVDVRIVDSAPGPTTLSKAIGVHARTMEIFQDLGVIDAALAEGKKMHGASIFSGANKITSLLMDELDSPFPFILDLEQSRTENILVDHLNQAGGAVERNTTMAGLDQDDEGVVVTLKRGDQEEAVRAAWLVGCDGAHSTTRHALGLEFAGEAVPQNFLLADVVLEWDRTDDELTACLSDNGILFAAPLIGGRARVIADVADDIGEVTLADVQGIIDERGPVPGKVSDPVWLTTFRINERQVKQYRVGRVFLAGDAAHIHSPAGGQGMNTGIQDAYNLAWKLAFAVDGRASEALIDSYDAERHPVGQEVLRGTGLATKAITLRNPVARHLRDKLAHVVAGLEVVQERMRTSASQLAVGYRDSAIVDEYRDSNPGGRAFNHGPLPGQRAPDGALTDPQDGAEISLFELMRGPTHCLLFFAGATMADGDEQRRDDVLPQVRTWMGADERPILVTTGNEPLPTTWDGVRVVDADGTLHARYGAERACLYVIRPDGYVGFRCQPLDGQSVLSYFQTLVTAR